MRLLARLTLLTFAPMALRAQAPAAGALVAPAPDAQQVAAAVLPLPREFRASALVMGYHAGSPRLVVLRQGAGPFTCLAANPQLKQFHVACYHASMEAFMERGRALRASGVKGDQVDSVRFAEVRSGKLAMPSQPAALYSLTGPSAPAAGSDALAAGTRALYVVYIPGASAATTGISAVPQKDAPWMMYPGTPKAHIMFVPSM